jgi:hypothetical protein
VSDILILGGIVFDNFSTPEAMPFGGRQAMAIHKKIGGARSIDTLGPDDADITWHGRFFGGAESYETALALDAMRARGSELPLSYAGQAYVVVISDFHADIRRLPQWIEYSITCVIANNGAQGVLSAIGSGVDALVSADLSAAIAL